MRRIITILLICMAAPTAHTQSLGYKEDPMRTPRTIKQAVGWRTPFIKREFDRGGRAVHYYFRPNFSRSTISAGWSYGQIQSFGWWSNSAFKTDFTASCYSSVGASHWPTTTS